MSAADDMLGNSHESLPAPRSKLMSLLGCLQPSKSLLQNHISDFHVKLHKPHHLHSSGDLVTGSIVLSTTKPMKISHITLTLSGVVMLFPSGRSTSYSNILADVRKQKGNQSRLRGTPVFASGGAKGVLLFEEETVIVGEGRLSAGGLEVGFEKELPAKGLVSSLDFERGTISYQLTATLTRPTTLNPVIHSSTEVKFRERVDVAYFHPPKPLTLSIEPMNGSRHRLKSSASSADRSNPSNSNSPQLSPTLPSHASNHGSATSGGGGGRNSSTRSNKTNSNSNSSSASVLTPPVINPTATIELQKAGCLPGDVIPLKISIYHTKPIKSLSGIIVTLSRQGRFDTYSIDNPTDASGDLASAPLTAKSLTFSRSPIATFRKDLDQTVAPLIVDPRTLTSVVRTSVRLPEDVFPSITNVPGGVVSFTYFVEVIVDLGGKLAQRGNAIASAVAGGMTGSGVEDVKRLENAYYTPRRGAEGKGGLDTHKLRREKGVISCTFEVVVGTCNSAPARVTISRTNTGASVSSSGTASGGDRRRVEEFIHNLPIQPPTTPPPVANVVAGSMVPSHTPEYQLQYPPTPPEPRDEKARIHLAETQLLPSAPPVSRNGGRGMGGELQPSAPIMLDEFDDAGEGPSGPAAPQYRYSNPPPPMSPLVTEGGEGAREDKQERERRRLMAAASAPPVASSSSMAPSAPAAEELEGGVPDYAAGPSRALGNTEETQSGEDKAEAERRRLMGMASAPPVVRSSEAEPSAPVMDDDGVAVSLPRYER